MKRLISIVFVTGLVLLISLQSCLVVKPTPKKVEKHDNGNHYGWYKNPNNPHNPNSNKGKVVVKEKTVVKTDNSKGNGNKGNKGNGNGKGKKK